MSSKNKMALAVLVVMFLCPLISEALITVNTLGEGSDADGNNPICEVNVGQGNCTLRAAIQQANASLNPEVIHFNLPGSQTDHTIPLTSTMSPASNVTIDGTTQPGYPDFPVVLDGLGLGAGNFVGLTLSGNVHVKGLVIQRFGGSGMVVSGSGNSSQDSSFTNNNVGVRISGGSDNTLIGNRISQNTSAGLVIAGGSFGNKIGGEGNSEANEITFNGQDGISLQGAGSRNSILANSISLNGHNAIDLGNDGITANDLDEVNAIFGVNNDLQNFPVITSATTNGCASLVSGTLNTNPAIPSEPNGYLVELFFNENPDRNTFGILSNGEGESFVGSVTVNADAGGDASFSVPLPAFSTAVTGYITATATSPNGSTSEFSKAVEVTTQDPGEIQWSSPEASISESDGVLNLLIQRACGSTGEASVTVSTSDGTAVAGSDYTAVSQAVTFAAGETEKTVALTILNDSSVESAETLTVTLSNPTSGAELGSNAQVVVTITDEDSDPSGGGSTTDASGSSGGCSLIR